MGAYPPSDRAAISVSYQRTPIIFFMNSCHVFLNIEKLNLFIAPEHQAAHLAILALQLMRNNFCNLFREVTAIMLAGNGQMKISNDHLQGGAANVGLE
jgi:hypothetical protein